MHGVQPVAGGTAATEGADTVKLRQAARQLTGLFAQQLFKAMRETVPTDQGIVSGGSGEEMFTGMLDEHLAGADTGAGSGHGPGGPAASARAAFTEGLADAVYRRLRAHAAAGTDSPSGLTAPGIPAAVTPAPTPASVERLTPPVSLDRR